jgi:hypothetical protein
MMFNSPTAFCPIIRTYVAIDQIQRDCALENACDVHDAACPLQALFVRRETVDSLGARRPLQPKRDSPCVKA